MLWVFATLYHHVTWRTASVLQCAAVCCSVLRCAAVCCDVLRCVAVCFTYVSSVLQIYRAAIAIYQNFLWRTASVLCMMAR